MHNTIITELFKRRKNCTKKLKSSKTAHNYSRLIYAQPELFCIFLIMNIKMAYMHYLKIASFKVNIGIHQHHNLSQEQ